MVVTIRIKFGLLLCLVLAIAITNAGISGSKGKAVHHIPHKLQGNIRGRDLRVVTGHFPPYISILRNSSGHITDYSDHMYQHLQYLSQKLEFTYTIFPAARNSIHDGVKSIDIWSAVIETITNLEADIGLVPATVSLERYESIEFCGFLGGDNTGILVKYPAANISFTSAFDVFSIEVWMWGIISGIAIATICRIFSYVTKRLRINVDENKPEIRAGTILMYFFGNTFSQGNYFPCQQPSQKLLVATWCFVTFVFVNTYNSTLTSYMSVTYQRPEVNSFRDLALATKYKATVVTGSIQDIDLRVIMKRPRKSYLKMVADRIDQCSSDCRKFSFEELAVSVLEEENCVSLIPWAAGIASLKKFNAKSCRLAMAFESTSWKPMFLAVPKSSPYKEEINRASFMFFDTGLRDYWLKAYAKPPAQCRLDYNSKGVAIKRFGHQIKLEHFHLPFLILFGGYLLAFIQFFREKLACPLRRRGTVAPV